MIDIGANLSHRSFEPDLCEVMQSAVQAGIIRMIVTGTSLDENPKALALAKRYPDWFACTAGVHPHHADEVSASSDWLETLAHHAQAPEVCALGETGLDYHRGFASHKNQQHVFGAQLDLAESIGKPLFVHERDTDGALADMLVARKSRIAGAVVHCFTGTREDLARYLDAGFMIGVTGWLCDERRGAPLQELIPLVPEDRLMIETDAPYLTPRNMPRPFPHRNEPANLVWIVRKLAELTGRDETEIEHTTAENARRFFSLGECDTGDVPKRPL